MISSICLKTHYLQISMVPTVLGCSGSVHARCTLHIAQIFFSSKMSTSLVTKLNNSLVAQNSLEVSGDWNFVFFSHWQFVTWRVKVYFYWFCSGLGFIRDFIFGISIEWVASGEYLHSNLNKFGIFFPFWDRNNCVNRPLKTYFLCGTQNTWR